MKPNKQTTHVRVLAEATFSVVIFKEHLARIHLTLSLMIHERAGGNVLFVTEKNNNNSKFHACDFSFHCLRNQRQQMLCLRKADNLCTCLLDYSVL